MSRGPWRGKPQPPKVDLGDHKVFPCRCGHFPHYLGLGKCETCQCPEYRPDEHSYTLGFGSTAT